MAPFPLAGIAGIVANNAGEIDTALQASLGTIELRADLLLAARHDTAAVLACVAQAKRRGLRVLFTARHPSHGGKFDGTEHERAQLSLDALAAGADVIDAEFASEAAALLSAAQAPLILSHHDFDQMLSVQALAELTEAMQAVRPLALKVVPTAARISDAARMLNWVGDAPADGPRRIGFAMGAAGACSRILTTARGGPITYAAFGENVAPGQIPLNELRDLYGLAELNSATRVYGIVGTHSMGSFSPFLHNPSFRRQHVNAVYVPLQTDDFDDLWGCLDALHIDGISVTNPYKERLAELADSTDARTAACGAANTAVITRDGRRHVHAVNTDFDGVAIPLAMKTRVCGARVAVIGNGGAARGAVMALAEAGAQPTLFFRNVERGKPVADELEVPGATLASLDDSYDIYINATTAGMQAGDPSPVQSGVFQRSSQTAFDMIYQNATTQFLDDARSAGCQTIHGAQMLIGQGVEQFKLFTQKDVAFVEFTDNYEDIKRFRP
jgi:3-dehydroquinate dehydratase / shikimate dehydrogenase